MSAPPCHLCGRANAGKTRDHILPRCRGRGVPGALNIQPMCRWCNQFRATVCHCPGAARIILGLAQSLTPPPVRPGKQLPMPQWQRVQNLAVLLVRTWGFNKASRA